MKWVQIVEVNTVPTFNQIIMYSMLNEKIHTICKEILLTQLTKQS
jgi:D-alanine-D-alanine ligase-like ATP-grasp enzyme